MAMLQFERLRKNTIAAIGLKERTSFLDKPLMQALFWSLIIHLVVFGTFRIRLNDYQDSFIEMKPLNVAIEDEPVARAGIQEQDDFDASTFISVNYDDDERHMQMLSQIHPVTLANVTESSTELDMYTDSDIEALAPKLTYAPKMFPIQLKITGALKGLTLTEDGSSLFRDKRSYDIVGRFILAPNHFPIEYDVKVDGATGSIEKAHREHELLDKRLQAIADRLIKFIRFKPFSEKTKTGSITLIFYCTGDEIKSFIND